MKILVLEPYLLCALLIPLGLLLAQALVMYIEAVAPVYLISIYEPLVFARTMIASLLLALIGALVPLRSLRRSDPVMAFQGA